MTETIEKKALYQQVADRLRHRIYQQLHQPGEAIDERALCELFGISRTPLREALKVLQNEGLVELIPNRGCFVRKVDARELNEIFPIMSVLEGLCAREAVNKMSAADLERLEQMHAELEQRAAQQDIEGYYEVNCRIHKAVQSLSANNRLEKLSSDLRRILRLARHNQLTVQGRLQQSLQEHRHIMQAFREHDAQRADQCMQEHLLKQWQALQVNQEDVSEMTHKQTA